MDISRCSILYSRSPCKSTTSTLPSPKSKSERRFRPPALLLDAFSVWPELNLLRGSGMLSELTVSMNRAHPPFPAGTTRLNYRHHRRQSLAIRGARAGVGSTQYWAAHPNSVRLRFDLEFELRTVETDIETASRSVALLLIGGHSLGQDRGRAIRVVRRGSD